MYGFNFILFSANICAFLKHFVKRKRSRSFTDRDTRMTQSFYEEIIKQLKTVYNNEYLIIQNDEFPEKLLRYFL